MFQFFFKYPRLVFSRGEFVLLSGWPKWLLVLLLLMTTGALAGLIRTRLPQAAPSVRNWRAGVIWLLQSCLAALLLILLWQPALVVAQLERQKNVIAVLIDDSRSMATTEEGATRLERAVKVLKGGVLVIFRSNSKHASTASTVRPRVFRAGWVAGRDAHDSHRRGTQATGRGDKRFARGRRRPAQRRVRQLRRCRLETPSRLFVSRRIRRHRRIGASRWRRTWRSTTPVWCRWPADSASGCHRPFPPTRLRRRKATLRVQAWRDGAAARGISFAATAPSKPEAHVQCRQRRRQSAPPFDRPASRRRESLEQCRNAAGQCRVRPAPLSRGR